MRCPKCEGTGRVQRTAVPKTCPACHGDGEFDLDPVAAFRLPTVERMELGRHYLNYNNVYTRPVAVVETEEGPHVVLMRFYRPSCWAWIERSMKMFYGRHDRRIGDPGPREVRGTAWSRVSALPLRHLRCNRSNPTWEIEYGDWKRALDDPKI